MKYSLTLGRIKGIEINLHFSFFLILILFGVFLSIRTFEFIGLKIGFGGIDIPLFARWLMGFITAAFLFFFLFFHELAHSLVSVHEGYKVREITFFLLGGMSRSESFPDDPLTELKIAGIGPLVSLGIGALFILLNRALVFFIPGDIHGFVYPEVIFSSLGFYNVLIGLFNLIPAFPLDGGRILRSILGNFMNHYEATIRAAVIGKGFAIAMGIFGILTLNLLLILVAVFVYMGAKNEKDVTETMHALENLKVADIMSSPPNQVDPSVTIEDLRRTMLKARTNVFVVKNGDRIIGAISLDELRQRSKEERRNTRVSDIMDRNIMKVKPGEGASDAWRNMIRQGKNRIFVIRGKELLGQVTRADFRNAIDIGNL
jgi:Zn-dependent protease